MSTDLLFEHFATLATAPEGIAQLRELILQLAVQGKLGTQDAGDEPASLLLERIRRERKQLIKDGKIRQEQSLEPIENNGLQNSLPDKWCLSKLGEYSFVIMGQSPESKFYNDNGSGLPFYQGKSEFGKIFPKPRVWCEKPLKIAQKNDILISVRAPVGPTNICPSESCIGRGLTALRSLSGTSHFFLLYSLRAYEKLISEMGVGSTFSAISKKDLDNFVIAVPPLTEQHRIVAKVDRLMALCDELEAKQQKERAGCLKLGTASLAGLQNANSPEEFGRQWAQVCDAFETILDCPENVAVLRQTILQLAVQGKLGTQNPGDEPADILAEKILKEKECLITQRKIKREEKINKIKAEDIPFEIPNSWQWIKLGNICNQITDGTHVTPKYISEGIPFLSVKNFSKGFIDFSSTKFISQEAHSEFMKRCKPEMNDLILTKVGTTGIAKVIDTKKEFSIFVSLALLKFSYTFIFPKYLELALNSPLGKAQSKFYTQGIGNKNLVIKSIKIFNLPLPPFSEQRRIVAKVDTLMALCDDLESRMKERAAIQTKFADAVVKNVGTG